MRTIDPIKQQAKRQHIVDAAILCFAKSGFHATSTAQICAQAGMSPGNVFHYFPTKDAIIQAIAELDRDETARAFAGLDAAEDVIGALQDLASRALALASDPTYAAISLEVCAEAIRNPAVAAMFEINDKLTRETLMTLLRRGQALGQVDPALDVLQGANWLIAILEGGVGRLVLDATFDQAACETTAHRLIARFLSPP